jgi:hypothetical protein
MIVHQRLQESGKKLGAVGKGLRRNRRPFQLTSTSTSWENSIPGVNP